MYRFSFSLSLILVVVLGGCSSNTPTTINRPDLQSYYDAHAATGAFVLYDLQANTYIQYNPEGVHEGVLPASTFKIFNTLVALETGAIADTSEVIPWDGVVRIGWDRWQRDHSLPTAFRYSVVWFYQELARRIGEQQMQHYLDTVGYGNQNLSGGIDQFWLRGGLRITPMEQVHFLQRLYHDDLPFAQATLDQVRAIMVMDAAPTHTLRYKTGWAVPGDTHYGWIVGYLEQDDTVYFFASQVRSQDEDFPMQAARQAITFGILEALTGYALPS